MSKKRKHHCWVEVVDHGDGTSTITRTYPTKGYTVTRTINKSLALKGDGVVGDKYVDTGLGKGPNSQPGAIYTEL